MVTDHVSSDGSNTPSREPESMAVDGCSSPVTFSDEQATASSWLTSIFLLLHFLPIRHWLAIESVQGSKITSLADNNGHPLLVATLYLY
ncbi:hypothetical protein M0R45_010602 [Rubus argutus]|uniref:Uncharacterized protein n=1 Tax=Rubus argutus TaxID=59490 RepID=A0AAW1Y9X5_RUBAR